MSLYSSRAPSYVKSTQKSVSVSPHVVPGYNPDVPQSFSSPAASQPTLLANAQTYDAVYGVDHSGYGSTTNVGFHNFVTAILQGSAPTADATNGRLVSLTDSDGHAQLYWQQPGNGYLFQLTSYLSSGNGSTTDGSGMSSYVMTSSTSSNTLPVTNYYGTLGPLLMRIIVISPPVTLGGMWSCPFKDASGNEMVFPTTPVFVWYSQAAGIRAGAVLNTSMVPPTASSTVILYNNGVLVYTGSAMVNTPVTLLCLGY